MTDRDWERLLLEIDQAPDPSGLRRIREVVHDRMLGRLPLQQPEPFYAELNEAHDAIIRRAIRLAQNELARIGKGLPPVPFAYVLFGSGGRREQTLLSDQDSGIIFADPADEAEREGLQGVLWAAGREGCEHIAASGIPAL